MKKSFTKLFAAAMVMLMVFSMFSTVSFGAEKVVKTIDNCDAVDGWQANGPLEVDADKKEGAGSLKTSSDAALILQKPLSTPIDLSAFKNADVSLEFWVYLENRDIATEGQVELTSAGAPDQNEYSWPMQAYQTESGWTKVSVKLSEATITGGDPNLSAINWVRVYWLTSGQNTMKIDNIALTTTNASVATEEPKAADSKSAQKDDSKGKITEAVKGTPVIDGKIDDVWAKAKVVNADQVNKTLIPSSTTTTGKVRTMWDENFFYILAEVKDSAVFTKATEGAGSEDKDSIEFQIDEANNKSGTNNVQAGNKAAGCFRVGTNDSEISGFGDMFDAVKAKIQGKSVVTDTGYIVEMAIPWSTIKPAAGTKIGMEAQINDNLDGKKRGGLVTWNSAECLGWRDTAMMGTVVLVDASSKSASNPKTSDAGVVLFAVLAGVSGVSVLRMRKTSK